MFKIGDVIKSKWGVMHTIAYIDEKIIYFVEGNAIYGVENKSDEWELVDKEELFGLKEVNHDRKR